MRNLREAHKGSTEDTTEDMTKDITGETRPEIVTSQSDLFSSIGERLSIAVGRGGEIKGREREKGKKLMMDSGESFGGSLSHSRAVV